LLLTEDVHKFFCFLGLGVSLATNLSILVLIRITILMQEFFDGIFIIAREGQS